MFHKVIKAKLYSCSCKMIKNFKTMEKRIRKNIQIEFRKIVKNIAGESSHERQEISNPTEPEIKTVGASTLADLESGELKENYTSESEVLFKLESSSNQDSYKRQASDIESSIGTEYIAYDPLKELSINFHSILKKEYFSDVNIKCGTDVLKAHKIVLCARSPVFEAMFTNAMQESEDGIVTIEDIEPHVLRDLLDFVYSGQLTDLTVTKACELMYVAEKYQIRTLKQLCVAHLRSNLSVENAFQILECANLYDTQLRSHTLKYISDHFSVIEKTEDWENIQIKSPTLALEVYSTVVKALKRKK